jgi:hypothetical protein
LSASTIFVGPIDNNGNSLQTIGNVQGFIPTGLQDSPLEGPIFNDDGSTLVLEDVIKGIFASVSLQPETANDVGSETSPEDVPPPPGSYLVRSAEKRLQPFFEMKHSGENETH